MTNSRNVYDKNCYPWFLPYWVQETIALLGWLLEPQPMMVYCGLQVERQPKYCLLSALAGKWINLEEDWLFQSCVIYSPRRATISQFALRRGCAGILPKTLPYFSCKKSKHYITIYIQCHPNSCIWVTFLGSLCYGITKFWGSSTSLPCPLYRHRLFEDLPCDYTNTDFRESKRS